MNNSPINATTNSTTVGELADATSLRLYLSKIPTYNSHFNSHLNSHFLLKVEVGILQKRINGNYKLEF